MDFPPFVNPSGWEGIVQTTEIIICVPPPYGRRNTKNFSERTLPAGRGRTSGKHIQAWAAGFFLPASHIKNNVLNLRNHYAIISAGYFSRAESAQRSYKSPRRFGKAQSGLQLCYNVRRRTSGEALKREALLFCYA